MRSANTVETRQYRKASKALLVLIPLLGITYLIVIAGPNEGLESHIFAVLRAFLLSIQGFSVALFYCFLNSEVRQALKHRFNRWRDSRNLSSGNSIRSRRYTMSKDYSPRSRTESIRYVRFKLIIYNLFFQSILIAQFFSISFYSSFYFSLTSTLPITS